jgi:hypothetical protein
MKVPGTIIFFAILLTACAEKKQLVNQTPPEARVEDPMTNCKDTTATAVFINKKTVEMRITISDATDVVSGNTVTHKWKSMTSFTLPPGDSSIQILRAQKLHMYTVYGPVSSSPNGQGVVNEKKIILAPCQKTRIPL